MPAAKVKDCESTWPFPVEEDGWYHAHNALRADLKAFEGMIATFKGQLAAGQPLSPSQQKAAAKYFKCWLGFLHHHHVNEDKIATPYLSTRFEVSEKVGADHRQLEVLVEQFEAGMGKLLGTDSLTEQRAALEQVSAVFSRLHPLCLEHFREEEEGPLVLMRRHFTRKEIERNVVAKILRSMDSASVGAFFRPMTREQRRAFARQERIPLLVRWILFRRAANYERKVWQPFARECLPATAAATA